MQKATPTPVDVLDRIDRATFLDRYRFQRPFILRGGARAVPAVNKWTLDYLESRIGEVNIQPLLYGEDGRDYSRAGFIEMTFRQFLAEIRSDHPRMLYWFEGPVSANFWGGQGKQARVNADLAMLAPDFAVPSFLELGEVIYAQMILGTGRNGTVVHHDYGGEAKCMMQILGEKHVLLIPPQHGHAVDLHPITGSRNFTISSLDLRGRDYDAILARAPVFEARIGPGDVLYWPSFWLHDIANHGEVNFAINAPLDEMPVNALMLRHLLATHVRRLREIDPAVQVPEAALARLESELLDLTEVRTLWDLHVTTQSYRGKHWRTRHETPKSAA